MHTAAADWVVFITGATSGIGKAAASAFAKRGARIILTGRSAEVLAEVAETLGTEVYTAVLDVRDRVAVEQTVENLPPPFQKVTHLVNNAGLALGIEPAPTANLDEWETMIDTNVKGLVYCTRALLPKMVAEGGGHILNMGSVAGSYPYPGGNVYGATKAFVEQFSLNLRADLIGTNIRVTNIEPGMVDTSFSTTRFRGDRAKADAVYANMSPLTADDIADIMLFCADRPAHLNVNRIEVMPVMQAFGPFAVSRSPRT